MLAAACANVSNVMLARAHGRHREIGVRLSLGASRGRVVRLLLTEGVMIACLAGLTGLAPCGDHASCGTGALHRKVLSVSGLYGVLTYMLSQRTKEIGIVSAAAALAAYVPARRATRIDPSQALRVDA